MSVLDLFDLHGRTALVTGASSGIGKKVAEAYLQAGAQVAIAARHFEVLEKVAAELASTGGTVMPIGCDVTQPDQVGRMVDQVTAELGGIDIAVCNAGIINLKAMLEMSPEEFQAMQDTNVTGVFLTAQAAARAMVSQGRGGAIINTASMSGHIINVPQQAGHYCTSKAAVIQLTKALAVELAPHNIRVNSVSPGYILTELVEPMAEYHRLWEPKIPLGRIGRPEELTGLYLYLGQRGVQLHDRFRRRHRRRLHLPVRSRPRQCTRHGRPKRVRTPGEKRARSRSPAGRTALASTSSSLSSSISAACNGHGPCSFGTHQVRPALRVCAPQRAVSQTSSGVGSTTSPTAMVSRLHRPRRGHRRTL